jgi:hypothetical protein
VLVREDIQNARQKYSAVGDMPEIESSYRFLGLGKGVMARQKTKMGNKMQGRRQPKKCPSKTE